MNSNERLYSAIKGMDVDHIPLWLRNIVMPATSYPKKDDFFRSWKNKRIFKDFHDKAIEYSDGIVSLSAPITNRYAMINNRYIKFIKEEFTDDTITNYTQVTAGDEKLINVEKLTKGIGTSWKIKHIADNINQIDKMLSMPFEVDMAAIDTTIKNYMDTKAKVGNDAFINMWIPSPIVTISNCMDFQSFLMTSVIENNFIHTALKEITRRIDLMVSTLLSKYDMDIGICFGGSEQCTPPMMSPNAFDEFVTPYDGKIVQTIKKYNKPITFHCHGKVEHALKSMIEMGVDATEPVECPPQGDLTFAQAKKIARGKITLIGNLEFSEMEHETPEYISNKVREIMSFGKRRTVIGMSAGPISRVTNKLMNNYDVLLNTYLKLR